MTEPQHVRVRATAGPRKGAEYNVAIKTFESKSWQATNEKDDFEIVSYADGTPYAGDHPKVAKPKAPKKATTKPAE